MKRKIITWAAIILMIAGICVAVCPYAERVIYDWNVEKIVRNWPPSPSGTANENQPGFEAYPGLYEQMVSYNRELYDTKQAGLSDSFSYEHVSLDLTPWGIENSLVGYLDIPAMSLKIPIYLGAVNRNLKKGIGHLSFTSLPIGGKNTNAVFAAHRGYHDIPMFRNIEQLKPGDKLTLNNLWGSMVYEVVETEIIRPDEIDKILIQEGRDLITLITCHPPGDNYQRYAVYCERII